jgi:hypothetical protein
VRSCCGSTLGVDSGGRRHVVTVWTLVILPRQARAYGYQLREDDLVFRRGILWQRMVAVPYGRMQLVDITHGPLDRVFGIAQLKLVTAAATTGVVIPGSRSPPPSAARHPDRGGRDPADRPVTDPAAVADVRSPLSDGEWHRLHPLTPVLRGGLFLVVVLGIVITNLRDRIIGWLFPAVADLERYEADPVDYVVSNNLILLALLAVLACCCCCWAASGCRGASTRSASPATTSRCAAASSSAPTGGAARPGAGRQPDPPDGRAPAGRGEARGRRRGPRCNVKLEYLSTANAEAVRADILRLASGRQLARAADAGGPQSRGRAAVATVSAGSPG